MGLALTSRQPSNAGGFRRLAVNKPINDTGKRKETASKPRTAAAGGVLNSMKALPDWIVLISITTVVSAHVSYQEIDPITLAC